jgi:predicted secreted protein
MSTNARIGHGNLFAIQNQNSPATYDTLAEVTNITPPGRAKDAVEATHTQSPSRYREYISGLRDGGECSIELNFVPGGTDFDKLDEAYESDELVSCRITFTDLSVWTFDAVMTGLEPEAPLDDKMVASATFKISGKPTFA